MSEPNFASLGPTLLARKGGAKPAMRPQLAPLPENFGEEVDEEKLEDLGWNDMGGEETGEDPVSAIRFESHGDDLIVDPLKGAEVVSIANRKDNEPAQRPLAANEDMPDDASPLLRHQDKSPTRGVLADAAMDLASDPEDDEAEAQDLHEATHPAAPQDRAEEPLMRAKAPAGETSDRAKPRRSGRAKPGERRAAFTLRLDPERHLKLRLASTMQGTSAQALLTEALDAMLAEFEELDALAARMKRH